VFAIDASEEFGRKGQQVREMTRDLELIKANVDLIAMVVGLRGVPVEGDVKGDGAGEGEEAAQGG
jgi:hypothetical protein